MNVTAPFSTPTSSGTSSPYVVVELPRHLGGPCPNLAVADQDPGHPVRAWLRRSSSLPRCRLAVPLARAASRARGEPSSPLRSRRCARPAPDRASSSTASVRSAESSLEPVDSASQPRGSRDAESPAVARAMAIAASRPPGSTRRPDAVDARSSPERRSSSAASVRVARQRGRRSREIAPPAAAAPRGATRCAAASDRRWTDPRSAPGQASATYASMTVPRLAQQRPPQPWLPLAMPISWDMSRTGPAPWGGRDRSAIPAAPCTPPPRSRCSNTVSAWSLR